MDMKQLEAFACVAEQRSFSKAARLLHLTQPTVSARVASLSRSCKFSFFSAPPLSRQRPGSFCTITLGRCSPCGPRHWMPYRGSPVRCGERSLWQLLPSPGNISSPGSSMPFGNCIRDISFDIRLVDSAEAVAQVVSRSAEIGFTGTLPESSKCLCREFADDASW